MRYMADRERYRRAAAEVIATAIAPLPGRRYALADAAQAHRDLEAGTTTGSACLVP
jgi:hypothetical protein